MYRILAQRAALAAAALVFVSGCNRDTEFEITRSFTFNATAGVPYATELTTVDLAAEAGSAWDHRDKLKSVKVVSVTGVAAGVAPAATTGEGSALIGPPPTATVLVGSYPAGTPIADGQTYDLAIGPDVNATIDAALNGDGQLVMQLTGTTADSCVATMTVTMRVEVEYSVSPF